jgi:hypothetical protein
MVKIQKVKPAVKPTVHPNRSVRRMLKNPTFLSMKTGASLNYLTLGLGAATMSMSGILFGICFRLIGL